MADYAVMGLALVASAAAAALVLLAAAWPWRKPHPLRLRVGWALALGAGIYAGCVALGQWPRWPAPEDRDRLLVVLLPAVIVVEVAAALVSRPRWVGWLLRLSLAGAAAPILLYNSTYLADLAGPHSAEWTSAQAAAILLGLGALLAAVWGLLALLQARASEWSASPSLALTSLAAALTVMLSGYYRGGLLGLPLAGSITGALAASVVAPAERGKDGGQGVAVIGLFSVLLIGRFFGSLPTASALCLLLAPLLAWVGEAPGVRRLRPSLRGAARLGLVAVPLALVVTYAMMRFAEESAAHYGP
jgi:hypothetical protein